MWVAPGTDSIEYFLKKPDIYIRVFGALSSRKDVFIAWYCIAEEITTLGDKEIRSAARFSFERYRGCGYVTTEKGLPKLTWLI